jgi:hypothetical protein
MTGTATALNSYLSATYGITLERALAEATSGVVSFALHRSDRAVDIECDLIGQHAYDDEGLSEHFAGTIRCEGVSYCFTCVVFTDGSGCRYVETIGELEVVGWGVRLLVR